MGWRRVEGKKAEESRCNYFRSSSWTDFKLVVVQGRLVDQPRRERGEARGDEEGEGWRPGRRINLVKPGESVTKTLKWSMGMRDIYRSKSVGWKRSHRSTVLGRRDTNGIFIISPQRPTPLADNGPTVWSIGRVTALTASHLFFFVSETRLDRCSIEGRVSGDRYSQVEQRGMGRDRWKWIYLGEERRGGREKEFFLFEENREKRVRDNCDINRSENIFFFFETLKFFPRTLYTIYF